MPLKYKYLHEQVDFEERTRFWQAKVEQQGVTWAAQLLAMLEEDIVEAHHKIMKKVEKKPHKMDKYGKAFAILQALSSEENAVASMAHHTDAPAAETAPMVETAKPVYTSPRITIAKGEARPKKKCSGCKTYCNPCKKELKRRKSL